MKHKHADLIHAWADGAEIQFWSENFHEWCDVIEGTQPDWYPSTQYRIKPEEKKPVVRWLCAWYTKGSWEFVTCFMNEKEIKQRIKLCGENNFMKLEWSRTEFPE
jgi:hypothetical protein